MPRDARHSRRADLASRDRRCMRRIGGEGRKNPTEKTPWGFLHCSGAVQTTERWRRRRAATKSAAKPPPKSTIDEGSGTVAKFASN